MSFNVQKSKEQVSSTKRPHFDFAKNDRWQISVEDKKRPSWIFAVLTLLVAGCAAWYLFYGTAADTTSASETTVGPVVTISGFAASNDTALAVENETKNIRASVSDDALARRVDAAAAGDLQVDQLSPEETDEPQKNVALIAAVFPAGSSLPQFPAQNIVAEIKSQMKKQHVRKIEVLGYASSEGNLAYNQAIAQARADAYKKYLIRNGIAASLIIAEGKGIDYPIAPNGTETGREKNRRVEIHYIID